MKPPAKKPANAKKMLKPSLSWGVFIIALFMLAGAAIGLMSHIKKYQQKIFPRTYLSRFEVSGLTTAETQALLERQTKLLETTGFTFKLNDKTINISPYQAALTDETLTQEILTFDHQAATKEAYNFGRSGSWWQNFLDQVTIYLAPKRLATNYSCDDQALLSLLQEQLSPYEQPKTEGQLVVNKASGLEFQAGKAGEAFDYQEILSKLKRQINDLDFSPINLWLKADYPRLTKDNTQKLLAQAQALTADQALVLTYEDKSWEVKPKQLKTWLEFQWGATEESQVTSALQVIPPNLTNTPAPERQIALGLKTEVVAEDLKTIAEDIDVPVQEGKFYLNPEGQMAQFQASRPGLELDPAKTKAKIASEFIGSKKYEVPLIVSATQPRVTNSNIGELGIKEQIAVGESNFRNSPGNRVYNIRAGSDILNGLLIAPDEEFSLVKALGKIDGAHGFLPELVIKGKKLKAEYGGGLCQVGTTMFRVALAAGLPITERTNHSFQVSYYIDENGKPGKDATIYDPSPDLKFINDTGHYLLLRSRIEGSMLYYEFWGTADGRQVEISDVQTYDRTSSPGTITEETGDLAPGETTCSGHNVAGVTAEFDYQVTYPDGEVKQKTFTSVYRPFSELCLVGKSEAADGAKP